MKADSDATHPSPRLKTLVTAAVILVAIAAVGWKFWDYSVNPWTRDGQVMAQVVQVTPRVSGTIVELPIKDNQFVKAGDPLFRIDPRTFQSEVDQKEAELDKVKDEIDTLKREVESRTAAIERYESQIEQAKAKITAYTAALEDTQATYERMQRAVKSGAVSRDMLGESKAQFEFAQARVQHSKDLLQEAEASKLQSEIDLERAKADLGALGEANARLRAAKAAVHHAHLELEFTEVRALVDGYVTNLNLRLGDHAEANDAVLALVDVDSFWISGFFKETALEHVRVGDRVIVTLMGYPSKPIEGYVDSIGWGVAQKDGSSDEELLPKISAAYEWVRLAQRLPVRVHWIRLPEDVELRVGTLASVFIMTGTAGTESDGKVAAAARAPQ